MIINTINNYCRSNNNYENNIGSSYNTDGPKIEYFLYYYWNILL